MPHALTFLRATALIAGLSVAGGGLVARPRVTPETLVLGRDGNGEPCALARDWRDNRSGAFDRAWAITCRGVTSARAQGWVLALRAPLPIGDACGEPVAIRLDGVGRAEARACFDQRLALPVVRLDLTRGGRHYAAAALVTALGPLEGALRTIVAGARAPGADAQVKLSFDPAALPPAPAVAGPRATAADVDPAALLQAGIALNHRGQYVEASRLLNDVLSRLSAATLPLVRAELELEAGLADSNIGQFDAAREHFDRGRAGIDSAPGIDQAAYLQAKGATYRGQDAINQRQFAAALALLGPIGAAADPLNDPATLAALNQPPAGNGVRAAIAGNDGGQLSRLLLEAQRSWARSVASLSLGRDAEARAALDEGSAAVDQLQRVVPAASVAALKARVQRQYGRLAARAGRPAEAVHDFDCALATVQGVRVRGGGDCPLGAPAGAGRSDAGGPMVAETELERASLLARVPRADPARVLSDFAQATDTLIASGASGNAVPAAMETYLQLLADADAKAPAADRQERFFRAIQAVGEPAVARQVALLQRTVTADGPTAARVRDRAELERTLIRLRYEIASAPAERLPALQIERADAETRLVAVDAQLLRNAKFRSVDDTPATVAAVRAALRPGEAYLKVVQLRRQAFGMVIDAERAFIYPLAAPADAVAAVAARVRASIRDDSGLLPFFDAPAAYALFTLIAGPAKPALLAAKALVIDPSGPLANLPAGVLVTDLDSVKRYAETREAAPNDLSGVAFLAGRAEITGALSPRSFLIARALPPSREPRPFIGFGQNAPAAALSRRLADERVALGTGCDVSYRELAGIMNANRPVDAGELRLAAAALGVGAAPELTGRAFTDRALIDLSDRGELAQYQVLHFATHGLPETRTGCIRVPPALVTTLAPPQAGTTPSDGLLSFGEIAGLRLDANLVVLSACDTASGVSGVGGRLAGQDESSATLDGLVRAFITANARAVLATYWKVPATASSDAFMRTFYARGRTETLGLALRDAQLEAIRRPETSHPYYWGAYFLVGDAGKTMLTPTGPAA